MEPDVEDMDLTLKFERLEKPSNDSEIDEDYLPMSRLALG